MAVVSYIPSSKLVALLQFADPNKSLNVRVSDGSGLSLEDDSFQQIATIDFAAEKVTFVDGKKPTPIVVARASRKTGEYHLTIFKLTVTYNSLKEVLAGGLNALESRKPGTLEKLSKIKTTTKRIVARDPADLFDSEGLSEKYAAKLSNGWWYGTNNSAQETEAWLKRACECAEVEWGTSDFMLA